MNIFSVSDQFIFQLKHPTANTASMTDLIMISPLVKSKS